MSKYIDADVYMKKLANIAKHFARSDAQQALMGRAMYCLEQMPAADVEPAALCAAAGRDKREDE